MLDNNNLHDIYLALGSNLGDKKKNIDLAIAQIELHIGQVTSLSSLYETLPVGFDSENSFLNAACRVSTRLQPLEVLESTQLIEKELANVASDKVRQITKDHLKDIAEGKRDFRF